MDLKLGPRVPQRGNAFSRALGRCALRLMGWRIQGTLPDLPKMVLIGAPHTSNYDGLVSFAVITALGLRAGTMIKDSAFRGPMGIVLRWLGAVPVNRRSPKGVIGQTIEVFQQQPQFVLVIAPEGTRAAARDWKKGFHHVALSAGVPIVPAAADYQRKLVIFGPPLTPGNDYDADFATLMTFYRDHGVPRHARLLSRPLAQAQGKPWKSAS